MVGDTSHTCYAVRYRWRPCEISPRLLLLKHQDACFSSEGWKQPANTPSCLCVSHVRKVFTHASAVSQNVPAQIPSTTGTWSDIDCTWYRISYFELFRQPYSKELMANNGLGHPPITPSPLLHWQLLLIRKLLEPSRATKEGGGRAGG